MENGGTKAEKINKAESPEPTHCTNVRSQYFGVLGLTDSAYVDAATPEQNAKAQNAVPSTMATTMAVNEAPEATTAPDTVAPDTIAPEAVAPDPEVAAIRVAAPEVTPPEAAVPEAVAPAQELPIIGRPPVVIQHLEEAPKGLRYSCNTADTTIDEDVPVKVVPNEVYHKTEEQSDAATIFEKCEHPMVIKETRNVIHWKAGFEPEAQKKDAENHRKEDEGRKRDKKGELQAKRKESDLQAKKKESGVHDRDEQTAEVIREMDHKRGHSEKKKEIIEMMTRYESVNILVEDANHRTACKILYNAKQANILETLLKKDEENDRVKAFLIPFIKENKKEDKTAISLISLAMKKLVHRCLKGRITMTQQMFELVDSKDRTPRVLLFEIMVMVPEFLPNKWGGAKAGMLMSPDGAKASLHVADIMSGKYDVKETIKGKFLHIFTREEEKPVRPHVTRSGSTSKEDKEDSSPRRFKKLFGLGAPIEIMRRTFHTKESTEQVQKPKANKKKKSFLKKDRTEVTEDSPKKIRKGFSKIKARSPVPSPNTPPSRTPPKC